LDIVDRLVQQVKDPGPPVVVRRNPPASTSRFLTYLGAEGISSRDQGAALTVMPGGKAGLGEKGDILLGQLWKYEDDGYMSVQDRGVVTFRGVPGSLPREGVPVCVDGHGGVIPAAGGRNRALWVTDLGDRGFTPE
jgi:hypothetical protein